MRECSVDGCDHGVLAKGLCGTHYSRVWKNGALHPEIPIKKWPPKRGKCKIDGCERPDERLGYCGAHYGRNYVSGSPMAEKPVRVQVSHVKTPIDDRFWGQVNKLESGCWEWTGWTTGRYGRFKDENGRDVAAHRCAYERLVGPIPAGLQIDHLCQNKMCVNPNHLEPVTPRENTLRAEGSAASINARKTHCPHGHPYDETNTLYTHNQRACRTCRGMSLRKL